jgi:hypothetical protein
MMDDFLFASGSLSNTDTINSHRNGAEYARLTLYVLHQLGWGPSLKTNVSYWLSSGGYAVKEISDPATNFTFEVTNPRAGKRFYVGNRKGFDRYILVQSFFYQRCRSADLCHRTSTSAG